MKLSVVMPVYNERETIEGIVARVLSVPIGQMELVIVDDFSTDGTREALRPLAGDPRVRVLYHDRNRGKGAALRTGFAATTGDVVIVQDADMEYEPHEYPRVLEPIASGRADACYGSRFTRGMGGGRMYLGNYAANRFLTLLSNAVSGLWLTDMETCYKAFRGEVIRSIPIEENRFGFEPEITAKVAAGDLRVAEVPISYTGRRRSEGKKIGFRDGLRAIWCIVKYNLRARRRGGRRARRV